MTEPTDAELTEVYKAANGEDTGKAQPLTTKRIFRAMRAAIAKWGTPPVVAGEPVAWYEYNADLDAWFLAYNHNPKAKTRPLVFGDTTPHPAQAQAGAVPLTDEQRNAIYDKHCFLGDNGWEINWWQVIDEVEAAHGIKGGQHGADT